MIYKKKKSLVANEKSHITNLIPYSLPYKDSIMMLSVCQNNRKPSANVLHDVFYIFDANLLRHKVSLWRQVVAFYVKLRESTT